MHHVTLGAASRSLGVAKSTLSRAIRDGKLSAIRNHGTNSLQIELSELERYRQAVAVMRATAADSAALQAATPERPDRAVLQAQIDGLRQVLSLLRAQLHDTQQQRDAWQQQAERLALPRPVSSTTEAKPAKWPPTEAPLQPATAPVPRDNPLVPIWRWITNMIGRVTAREPTTPLPPFRRGAPAGEQESRGPAIFA